MLLSGCAYHNIPMPDLSEAREGDLILSFNGTPESWLFVQISKLPEHRNYPPYSHVEILLKNDKEQWEIAGIANSSVRRRRLKSVLPYFRQVAIVRPSNNPEAQERFVRKAKKWLATPEIRDAGFVYTFEDIPNKTDAFYCVSFVNELHRQCGLDVPMPAYDPWPNLVLSHINRLSHLPQSRTINAPISVFDLPEHQVIATWTNPHTNKQQMQLDRVVMQILFQWYDQGWQLIQSNQIGLLLKISDFPEELHAIAKLRVSLQGFVREVHQCWARLKRRGQLQEDIPQADSQQMQNICLKYRDKYFQFVGQVATGSAVDRDVMRQSLLPVSNTESK
ncbi:MAG: hypothetical protein JKX85_14700 [Phycisphaeraceae bacterium]|nr:hypothetical protein [Phycisphaeraceae bacterium]